MYAAPDGRRDVGQLDVVLTFGEWLDDMLIASGHNQTTLAAVVGVKANTVSSWVSGGKRPQRRRLPAMARALAVDEQELGRRAGYARVRHYASPEAQFRALRHQADVYDDLRDLFELQRQLERAMVTLQRILDERGVQIVHAPPES